MLIEADRIYETGRQPTACKMKYLESCNTQVKARTGLKSSRVWTH